MTPQRRETLEALEGPHPWPDGGLDSFVNGRCRALWRKPTDQFTIEDLRIMIGQQLGLRHLMPIALMRLEQELFAEGDFYEGDLLQAVLRAERAFWLRSPDALRRAHAIAARALEELPRLDTTDEIRSTLRASAEELLAVR